MTDLPTYEMLIDGDLVDSSSGESDVAINPATGDSIGHFPVGTVDDAKRAVDSAYRAYPAWRDTPLGNRRAMLIELARRLRENMADLAHLECLDTGSPITTAERDIGLAAGKLDFFAGLGLEMKGETVPSTNRRFHFTLREPFGVVLRIVPFQPPGHVLWLSDRSPAHGG